MALPRRQPPVRPLWRRLIHWGPIIAISIVGCIAITSIYCHLQWWPPERSLGGLLDMVVFLIWNFLCLSNLLQASFIGPGYVPLGWKPENPEGERFLQFCEFCDGFKAPRAHHCRQCNRCVMKMDHHCPWINNCVGHRNHGYFVGFLISAVIGCIHAAIILASSLYYALFRPWYLYYGTGREPNVQLGLHGLFALIFSFGLAAGVVVAVGFLFFVQLRMIWRNRTGVEDYILAKALSREREDEFVYPYDLGWRTNMRQVLTWDLRPASDGITWPVRDGCDQYVLTKEQLEQKRIKQMMAMEYVAVESFRGQRCSPRAVGGCRACCAQPLCHEGSFLKMERGDRISVMRWRRHWLYGQKIHSPIAPPSSSVDDHRGDQNGVPKANMWTTKIQRGWFPRKCAVDTMEDEDDNNAQIDETKSDHQHQDDGDESRVESENGTPSSKVESQAADDEPLGMRLRSRRAE